MTILVTGGGGYVGSVLTRELLKKGKKVRVLDKFFFGKEPLFGISDNPNLEVMEGDVRHIEDLARATRNVDAVIHLAGIVGGPACDADPDLAIQVNREATKALVEICKHRKVRRLIFASTCSVYGATKEIANEKTKVNPLSLYARSKVEAEKIIFSRRNDNELVPCIFRLSTVYGLSPRMRFDLVLNILTAKAVMEKKIKIYGGKQWRPLIHVKDVANAFVACLEVEEELINKAVFNAGSNDQNFQITKLGQLVKKCVPETKMHCIADAVDKRTYRVSFDKIRETLSYRTKETPEKGIKEIKEALENGIICDYKNEKYYNVRHYSE